MKYGLLVVLGIALGFLGEEMAVRTMGLLPEQFILKGFAPVFLLFVMFVPFLIAAFVLVTKGNSYCSFFKGLLFSLSYYLPAQYKAIWISLGHPGNPLTGSFVERVGMTIIGAFALSGIYYLFVTWQRRMSRKYGT